MKIRTKLLTAVLATATALSCALTASALTAAPALNLQGNETAPAKVDAEGNASATLTLKASDFREVKGAKITVELPAGLTLSNIAVTDTESTWALDANNYKFDADRNKITMVDVFNFDDTVKKDNLNLKLSFNVTGASIGTYEVKVSGDFADGEATQVYTSNATGNLVINRAEASAANITELNTMVTGKDYFIPYGGASIGGKSLTKNGNGTFDLGELGEGKINVLKCKLPAEGKKVTTFAISPHMYNATSIQFGSYAPNTGGIKCGTFVIIGDYQAFKAAKANNLTDEEVLQKFGKLYETTILGKGKNEDNYMTIKYNETDSILVGRKSQEKYMWQGDSNQLQYALRMTGINGTTEVDKIFTAVGYSLDGGNNYNFSAEMQSTTLRKLYPDTYK